MQKMKTFQKGFLSNAFPHKGIPQKAFPSMKGCFEKRNPLKEILYKKKKFPKKII
jgi:hypothetical protein